MNFTTDKGIYRRLGIQEFVDFQSALKHYSKLKNREFYEIVLLGNGNYKVQFKENKNEH